MGEIVGGLITLFFEHNGLQNLILWAIFGMLIYLIAKVHATKILTQHGRMWKKHEEDSNPELMKIKKDMADEDKKLLRDVKSTLDLFSINLESFKKDILHEYAQLKQQIGFIIKSSEQNSEEIEELKIKFEVLENKFRSVESKFHIIEIKLGSISSGF